MTPAQEYCLAQASDARELAEKHSRAAARLKAACAVLCLRRATCSHQSQIAAELGQAAVAQEHADRWRAWADDPDAAARAAPREQLTLFG